MLQLAMDGNIGNASLPVLVYGRGQFDFERWVPCISSSPQIVDTTHCMIVVECSSSHESRGLLTRCYSLILVSPKVWVVPALPFNRGDL